MADSDLAAMMGITAFGAKKSVRKLDGNRYDKNKRGPVVPPAQPAPVSEQLQISRPVDLEEEDGEEDDDNSDGSSPAGPSTPNRNINQVLPMSSRVSRPPRDEEEPQYDPDAPELSRPLGRFDSDDTSPPFPITHELPLKDHNKVISALALDPSGARIVSGSHDYDCKLWDFGGMDSRCKPFRSWEPAGNYYINDLKYSNKGDKFLVISGTSQAKLYERDGEEIHTFIKGDPYIRDMKNTNGHVADISSCMWHPNDAQLFITGSADSTIRIWDVENKRKQKTVIVVKSKERGARTRVTACSYSPDGSVIAGACLDGALHLWNTSSNYVRPNLSVESAHAKNTETGSVIFALDGKTILTRGGDDTVKLWDTRKFKQPVVEKTGITTLYPGTNAIFSPDEQYVLTGTGWPQKGNKGRLLILRRETLEKVESVELDATVVKVAWHPRINQIVAGTASGQITVLFSPFTSSNGAKLIANKGPPRKATIESISQSLLAPTIVAPHALPMFKDGDDVISAIGSMATKRKREKARNDPRKSRRPELPVVGPGKGGRVGASATQHVVQNLFRDTTRDVDVSITLLDRIINLFKMVPMQPREALLKYAEKEGDLKWTAAWKDSGQVFAPTEENEGENEDDK